MSNIIENYGWDTVTGPESCGYIAPEILDILENLKVKRVCDLGSGNGALVATMRQAGYYAVGVEQDKKGIALSQKNYPDVNFYNLGVHDDPAQLLTIEDGGFDAVVSTEVVEHLFSPHLLPIFARKLLYSGGFLIVSTPYHGYLKNLALSIFNKWDKHHTALWHGGHIKFWSRKTLSQLLEQNGFRVVAFHGAGRFPYLWKSMILVAKMV